MTEKMILTIESALHRVLHEALKKADGLYPRRAEVSSDYLLHLQCVNGILAWFEVQIGALRKIRLAPRFARRPVARRHSEDLSDDWDILLSFFAGSPGTLWMMSIGLSALPQDIRLMLGQMTYVLELAVAGEMQRCLDSLQDLADSLAADSGQRGMFQKEVKPMPRPQSREEVERNAKAMAERFKTMLQPRKDRSLMPKSQRSIK